MSVVPRIEISPQGPVLSGIAQGYWRLADWGMTAQQRLAFIASHVEQGITTVDHAHVYGNPSCESLFGEALKLDPGMRARIEIISKCGICLPESGKVAHYDSSKAAILASVETSLKRLGVEHLDVLLLHRPDYLMDVEEVALAFGQLQQQGKVGYFGVSNFSRAQYSLLRAHLDMPLVTNQLEINPVNLDLLDSGILEDLQLTGTHPMAWSCLGGGRIFTDSSARMAALRAVLQQIADETGATSIEQVVYAWIMKLPSRPVPVLGSGRMERMLEAVRSIGLLLDREQWYRVWTASRGHAVP